MSKSILGEAFTVSKKNSTLLIKLPSIKGMGICNSVHSFFTEKNSLQCLFPSCFRREDCSLLTIQERKTGSLCSRAYIIAGIGNFDQLASSHGEHNL